MERFKDDCLYRSNDPALLVLGTPGTMAVWRSEFPRGPAWIKLGGRILYSGKDLNREYLNQHRVDPSNTNH